MSTNKENIILVIGNGFDIANGYKTKYGDFLSFIKEKKFENIEDIEIKNQFVKISNTNSFVKHFIALNKELNTWVDVEREMKNIVDAISEIFTNDSYYITFNEIKRQNLKSISEYIETIIIEFNFFEKEGFISRRFYSDIYGIIWEELEAYLYKELNDFKQLLIWYLKYYMPLLSGTFKSINQLEEIRPNHIITFNYTDYYKKYYTCDDVYHIHGKLDNNEIVLGYEDNEGDNLKFVKFKKYFQRLHYQYKQLPNSIFNEKYVVEGILGYSNKTNIVHVYGMSLDVTDKETISFIYEKVKKFIVYYYNDDARDKILVNLIEILGKERVNIDYSIEKLVFIKTIYD